MPDTSPSTRDEKASLIEDNKAKRGFFARRETIKTACNEKSLGIPIEISPVEAQVSPVAFTALFRFSTKYELFINAIGLVAAAAAGAAQPLMTLLLGNLTQDFVTFEISLNRAFAGDRRTSIPEAAERLRKMAALKASYLAYVGVGMFICTYTYMSIWIYTGEVNAKRVRERYLRAVLRQDIQFFDSVGAGEVATRIQTDTHLVQQGVSEKVALVVKYLATFFTGFIIAYIRSWRLALALSPILPCLAISGSVMNKAISECMQLSLKHVASGGSLAEEVISTVRTAQALGTQKILSDLYDGHMDKSLKMDLMAAVWHGGGLAIFFFVVYSAYALAFSFGITLINSNHTTPGAIINVFSSILTGSFSLVLLAPEMRAITHGCGAAAKLYQTIDRVPEIDSANPEGQKPRIINGKITLEDVKFSYPSRPNVQVISGLSINFCAGKTTALVGTSGSGKSTIISLIERFYDPTSGAVKLDGINVKDLNLKWLRSQIGLVSQEPTLFATSITANIAHGLIGTEYEYSSKEYKFALIKEACIKANADGFITKLPMGYDTLVGERGFLLSGGQKQRIAIARAIVSDPRILLLDEATSALDTQSEGIVQDALDKASAGRTTIIISHRLSTIKDADVIYVMGEGLILEYGTHDELLSYNGAYARLVQAQRLRKRRETYVDDPSDTNPEHMEKAPREVPFGRKNTVHFLASEILEQKKANGVNKKESTLNTADLFIRMGKINRTGWRSYLFGSTFAAMTGTVYPALGIVLAKGIQTFSLMDPHERRFQGDRTALWLFIIALISTLCIGMQNYLLSSFAATLTAKLRSLSFRSILEQDIEYFDKDKNSTGSLTANLSNNPQKINGLAGVTAGAIVQCIATLVAGSIIGLAFIWKLALVSIACSPLLVSTGYIRLRVIVLKDQANKAAHESSAQLACEAAASIRTIAALTRENDCCDLYSASLEEPLRKSNRTTTWSNLLFSLSQPITFFVIALVFWFGSRLVSSLEYSTFRFFVGLMSTTLGAIQAGNIFSFVPDVSSAKGAASDIIKLIDSVPEIGAESKDDKFVDSEKIQGHIRFENVHFKYPTRPGVRVLRNLSFQVEPGRYIALVGASGSGKSTVIQLIERFYNPLAGEIFLDSEPIIELNIQDYRRQIALVSQEPTLYAGTVRFNILLGAIKPHSEVTQEEIEKACRDANILDFILSLPDGFDTEVGGKGSQLSGGQKQRIAIARALLRNPKVLLLDEATSALDSNSERIVQEALDQAAKGRTTIAIAHRLSTIQNADRIYFIKEGRVSESGTHDQLLSKRGDYYEYVQLQALNKCD